MRFIKSDLKQLHNFIISIVYCELKYYWKYRSIFESIYHWHITSIALRIKYSWAHYILCGRCPSTVLVQMVLASYKVSGEKGKRSMHAQESFPFHLFLPDFFSVIDCTKSKNFKQINFIHTFTPDPIRIHKTKKLNSNKVIRLLDKYRW